MSIYVAQESRHCCGMRKSEINATSQNSGNLQRDFHKFSRIPQLGSINDDVSNGKKVFKEIWHFTKFDVLSQKSSSIFKSQMSSFSWKWKFKPWSFSCQKFRPVNWPKQVVGAKLKLYIKFHHRYGAGHLFWLIWERARKSWAEKKNLEASSWISYVLLGTEALLCSAVSMLSSRLPSARFEVRKFQNKTKFQDFFQGAIVEKFNFITNIFSLKKFVGNDRPSAVLLRKNTKCSFI